MEIIAGVIMGALLIVTKIGSYYLFTGGKEQWKIWPTNTGIRTWINQSNVRKALIDAGFGYIGSHVIATNSVPGLFALGTYMIVCMFFIFKGIMWEWAKDKAVELKDKTIRIIPT